MRAVGLEDVSLPSLRHTNATESLRNGVPLAEVSRRLGHADQNITLSIYSHAMPADDRAAAKVWDDSLGDVIESSKKREPDSTTARRALRNWLLLETKEVRWRGRRGSNPATSDVTGRGRVRERGGSRFIFSWLRDRETSRFGLLQYVLQFSMTALC